jgi:predicted HAD superfamily Cof-like phosphohydrolase
MTTKLQRQVIEFHATFGHPTAESPTIPDDDRVRFRAAFIVEECLELLEACFDGEHGISIAMGDGLVYQGTVKNELYMAKKMLTSIIQQSNIKVDLPLAVDALADIDYVVEGCRLEFGVNGEPIADEVHRSNMRKAHKCPLCLGSGLVQKNDTDSDVCPRCLGGGVIVVKRADGKTLKPEGWTPPDIAGELEKQRNGMGEPLGEILQRNPIGR